MIFFLSLSLSRTIGPKSISFVVQLDDDEKSVKNSSFKSSRLPKRLQRLQEEQDKNPTYLTAEEIAERQKLAEKRRKSALEERIMKSKQFQAKVFAVNRSENRSIQSNNSLTNSPNEKGSRTSTVKQVTSKNAK